MKKINMCLYVILLFLSLELNATTLTIACSSNFVTTLKSLTQDYQLHSKDKIDILQGSSGKLTTELLNGLPADIFLSANKSFPKKLYQKGYAYTPFLYGIGELILLLDEPMPTLSLVQFLRAHEKIMIGMAMPELAPYGQQARDYLKHVNLWDTLKLNVIYGHNINQTFQQFITHNLKAAFVAHSQWLAYLHSYPDGINTHSLYRIPVPFNQIPQYGVILKKATHQDAATQFVHYLLHNPTAKHILERNGYQSAKM